MSVFNALSTAVSGINAQSTAFTNLSNNIANSQTVGYKATTTAFQDFVAGAGSNTASSDSSDSVAALTIQHVDDQGTSSTSTDALASAISGSGLFVVSTGTTSDASTYYTRNGEVYEDDSGYLVNTSGYYLDGYMVDSSTGALSTTLTQLNVSDVTFKPTETTTVTSTATVGSTSTTGSTYNTAPVTVYDSTGTAHQIGLTWTQSTSDPTKWTVSAYDADGTGDVSTSSYVVTFDSSTGDLASVADADGTSIASTSGSTAEIPITATYNGVSQTIELDLGTIGSSSGTNLATTSSGTAATSQVAQLSASGTTLTMGSSAVSVGSTTGSDQTYMTAPTEIGGETVSALWTQSATTSSNINSGESWTVELVNPTTGTVLSGPSDVTFDSSGALTSGNTTLSFTGTDGNTYSMAVSSSTVSLGTSSPYTDTTSLTSDSVTTGTYEGTEITSDGSVEAEFSTGTQLIGKIALANFADVNGLEAVDGQAYEATTASGTAEIGVSGENGTGTLSVGYVESSTTDLTKDLASMIVAQEAYTANTKVVTSADTMLQATIAMIQ
ncbi:MAG: flagellar hook-basal body complex protein [Acetobacter papayae]|uniref:flagellar hook-basal body complex protein n=1 Tax=Acetobacter papayae TaxID=1076592 RepID=UPI0039EB8D44